MQSLVLRRRFSALIVALFVATPACVAGLNELDVGVTLFNQGKYADAIVHLSAAQAVPNQTARALYYRALAELKLGRKTAMDTLRALVAVAPDSPEGRLAERYIAGVSGLGSAQAPALQLQRQSARSGADQSAQAPALQIQEEEWNPPPAHVKVPYTEGRDGWMHVQATINTNQIVDMVWDTGASNCSIPANIYGRLPEDTRTTQVETPLGKEAAYIARVPLDVGGLKRSVLTTFMSGTAVIGQSFFRDYAVEVDRKAHLIYLDRIGAPPRRAADNTAPDSSLVISADGAVKRVVRGAASVAPAQPKPQYQLHFERESGLLLIDIYVDNRRVQAYFDTGCAAKGIAMTAAMAASARDRIVEKVDKQIDHQKIVNLTLGPINLQDVKVTIANGLSRPLVGPAILGRRGYRIDPARQEIDFDMFEE